jgi:hypothetical protein
MTRFLLLSDSCKFVDVGRSFWWEDGSVISTCCWPLPGQSFSGPSPVKLMNIFYCLRFGTSLFVASYDSQEGIRLHLHIRNNWLYQVTRVMYPRSGPIEDTIFNSNFNSEIMNVCQELKVVACWEVVTSSINEHWCLSDSGTSFEIFLCQVWFVQSLWLDFVSVQKIFSSIRIYIIRHIAENGTSICKQIKWRNRYTSPESSGDLKFIHAAEHWSGFIRIAISSRRRKASVGQSNCNFIAEIKAGGVMRQLLSDVYRNVGKLNTNLVAGSSTWRY